jgi:hypothetical protein
MADAWRGDGLAVKEGRPWWREVYGLPPREAHRRSATLSPSHVKFVRALLTVWIILILGMLLVAWREGWWWSVMAPLVGLVGFLLLMPPLHRRQVLSRRG